jgi:hypothetical protein
MHAFAAWHALFELAHVLVGEPVSTSAFAEASAD